MDITKNNVPYEYTDKNEQYRGVDLSQKICITNAQYIDQGAFTGNRYLEALPPVTSDQSSINQLFTFIPPLPDWDELEKMDPVLRDTFLDKIVDVRFPLPYHMQLKTEFYKLLCRSYRKRVEGKRLGQVNVQGNIYNTEKALLAHPQGEAIDGLAVIGPSGTGKSTSVGILLRLLPQVILHDEGGKKTVQIVYLFVTSPEISNFNALYQSIAAAIDEALGNGMNLYENEVNKIKGLGNKSLYIKKLIEGFAIGLIILDEIQHIDLKTTNENSIEALLRLNNDTHVGFVVMGLPEAFRDLFYKPHTKGRFPIHLQTGDYCDDLEQVRTLINMLFISFDFCDGNYEVDDEMVNIFHRESNGCVKYIDILFSYIVKDYLNMKRDTRPYVDAEFVQAVAKKHDVSIREEMNKKITMDASDIAWLHELNKLDSGMDAVAALPEELSAVRNTTIDILSKIYQNKYNLSRIENAVDIYINKGYTDQGTLIAKATEHLLKNRSDIRSCKSRKKVTQEESMELLNDLLSE